MVIRMNRDTLYSSGVFDLEAGPVTVRLPDAGDRFMSLLPISQDHYTTGCVYGPGPHTFTNAGIGTRYVSVVVRILVDPGDAEDLDAVHALQDAIIIEQEQAGTFEIPDWDPVTLAIVRDTLLRVASGQRPGVSFGTREEVDPIRHLVMTAAGWGGNPERDAKYMSVFPEHNDGATAHRLTVRDVPVDGFWSISVYNEAGYFVSQHRAAVLGEQRHRGPGRGRLGHGPLRRRRPHGPQPAVHRARVELRRPALPAASTGPRRHMDLPNSRTRRSVTTGPKLRLMAA